MRAKGNEGVLIGSFILEAFLHGLDAVLFVVPLETVLMESTATSTSARTRRIANPEDSNMRGSGTLRHVDESPRAFERPVVTKAGPKN